MTTEPALQKILDAWNNPGRVPWFHDQAKRSLRKQWPTLANALDEASRKALK